jgi:DNA helicase-2/ATP-dependent DNA helicase PcrA
LCYVGITRAKENLFLTCSKQRTVFGSTSCNPASRFLSEIPEELLDGYDEAFNTKKRNKDVFEESKYSWHYGESKIKNGIKTYKVTDNEPVVAASSVNTGFNFKKTAESFLNSLSKKNVLNTIDFSSYQEGTRVFHKKFGEGTISFVETEGDDLKVDIDFDKAGHKRLMAKYAGLEII